LDTAIRRVLVIGSGGSGKSTFAKSLGKITRLPVIHLDGIYWKPNWTRASKEEWKRTISALLEKDEWIMDGNYGGSLPERIAAADTIVYFQINRIICLLQALYRIIRNDRIDKITGCSERINLEYLQWIWEYPGKDHKKIMSLLEERKDAKNILIFKNRRQKNVFISRLESEYGKREQ
jgi:adenylate kinase family enzyme